VAAVSFEFANISVLRSKMPLLLGGKKY